MNTDQDPRARFERGRPPRQAAAHRDTFHSPALLKEQVSPFQSIARSLVLSFKSVQESSAMVSCACAPFLESTCAGDPPPTRFLYFEWFGYSPRLSVFAKTDAKSDRSASRRRPVNLHGLASRARQVARSGRPDCRWPRRSPVPRRAFVLATGLPSRRYRRWRPPQVLSIFRLSSVFCSASLSRWSCGSPS